MIVASVENLRQAKDEDLVKYADRAGAQLHDLNLAYKPLTQQLRRENDKRVARYFVRGLNNMEVKRLIPLGVISNLDDSIAQVLNLEATTGSNVSARDLFCQTCRSVGHRESSCRLKNRDTNEVLTSLLLSMSTRNPTNRYATNNNRQRPTNFNSNSNNGQVQNRSNFNNYPSQMNNNNNQAQNRGNSGNYSSQMTNQQQNFRNKPMGANNNLRVVNAEDGVEDSFQDQLQSKDYNDNIGTDLPDQFDQNSFFQDDYSEN